MERVDGLEPTLFHIGSVVPYQLGDTRMERDKLFILLRDSLRPFFLTERVIRIELTSSPWQGDTLTVVLYPLMVGPVGFEPTT